MRRASEIGDLKTKRTLSKKDKLEIFLSKDDWLQQLEEIGLNTVAY